MATTVVVRGAGGTLFEMDVPAGGTLLDTWNEKIASGELVIVTSPVKWVDGLDGAKHLVLDVTAEPEPEPPAEDAESGRCRAEASWPPAEVHRGDHRGRPHRGVSHAVVVAVRRGPR